MIIGDDHYVSYRRDDRFIVYQHTGGQDAYIYDMDEKTFLQPVSSRTLGEDVSQVIARNTDDSDASAAVEVSATYRLATSVDTYVEQLQEQHIPWRRRDAVTATTLAPDDLDFVVEIDRDDEEVTIAAMADTAVDPVLARYATQGVERAYTVMADPQQSEEAWIRLQFGDDPYTAFTDAMAENESEPVDR